MAVWIIASAITIHIYQWVGSLLDAYIYKPFKV